MAAKSTAGGRQLNLFQQGAIRVSAQRPAQFELVRAYLRRMGK